MAVSKIGPSGLNDTIVSGKTALAATPAGTDELLISDAGTIKRIDTSFFFNTPAFHAFASASANLSNSTDTKVAMNSEVFDSDGKYDNSTYRFTPTVAGKYYVYGQANLSNSAGEEYQYGTIMLYKNGSEISRTALDPSNNANAKSNQVTVSIAFIVDMDSDDYVEIFVKAIVGSGTPNVVGDSGASPTFFGAYRIVGV